MLLNVSFGIFAFLPMGWLFMAFVILLECMIASRLLTGELFNRKVCASITGANVVSGIVGIVASMLLNGGWWLVVWFPWVGANEVGPGASTALTFYYLAAFVLSVAIELFMNRLILTLDNGYDKRAVRRTTLIVNVASYIIGSGLLYAYSFG